MKKSKSCKCLICTEIHIHLRHILLQSHRIGFQDSFWHKFLYCKYHIFLNSHFPCNLERISHLYIYYGSLYNHICHTLVHTFLLRNVSIFASTWFPCKETYTLHSHILRISENTCIYCSPVRICYWCKLHIHHV